MCGLAGFMRATAAADAAAERAALRRMTDALAARGPDASGHWDDAAAGVYLGHRRLAVLDLTPAGAQPMRSGSGRFTIALNGEVYNHAALRLELERGDEGVAWRGRSDTETLLAGFERWGVRATLARAVGMFAFALWDARERSLCLARDRFGEKPLYYGWVGEGAERAFAFGSQLAALRRRPGFANPVCRQALALYLQRGCVPAPRSIHQGVFKLEPGCLLEVRGAPPAAAPATALRAGERHGSVSVERWWSLADVVVAGVAAPIADEHEALALLERGIDAAVRDQALADVPLGAFLSGGVDSSTVVASMQQTAMRPVRTFTVGFEDAGFDEAPRARAVAAHLGTEHHELRVTAADARALIADLPRIYDEPFADASQIPTHLVCRAARQQVTVALSGDGGDEVFGGYNRYLWGPRIWRRVAWLPFPVRRGLGRGLDALSASAWSRVLGPLGVAQAGDKVGKLARGLAAARTIDELYRDLLSAWPDGAMPAVAAGGAALALADLPRAGVEDARARMMFWDATSYLPDDILCKVDRAAMAVGLETRAPLLDHRLVELAWRMPLALKFRGGIGKWGLRQVLYRRVPQALIDRPKAGFGLPLGDWLRGPLRAWADALLDGARLRREGFLDPEPVRRAWAVHLAGRRDHTRALWTVLMFQAWLEAGGERA